MPTRDQLRTNARTTYRAGLTKDQVFRAAVGVADEGGIAALTMRKLAEKLGVEAMSLYHHVVDKDEVLAGMVDVVVSQISTQVAEIGTLPSGAGGNWKTAVRHTILTAREVLLRHPWAPHVIESRTTMSPTVMGYYDSLIRLLRQGGLPVSLVHHAMHALGSRMFGFTQELYTGSQGSTPSAAQARQLALMFPHIAAVATIAVHDDGTIVGPGCDDAFEFEFALDLVLDGFELLRRRNWRSADRRTGLAA